jgi:hypothetical protein
MYVWEQLHVQGRRISCRARRRQKVTDSYPFIIKKKYIFIGKFQDFLTIWWKAPFWPVEKKKKEIEI